MDISDIFSNNIGKLLENDYQKVYDFLDSKYIYYDNKFDYELNELYCEVNIYDYLNLDNKKHLSFFLKLILLYDRYMLDSAFCNSYDKLNNIENEYILQALKDLKRDCGSQIYNIENSFSKALELLNSSYNDSEGEGESVDRLNYIVKSYIYQKLKLKQYNNDYIPLLRMFKKHIFGKYKFINIEFFDKFLSDAENKVDFIDKWELDIHNYYARHDDIILDNVSAEVSNYANDIRNIKYINFDRCLSYCNNLKNQNNICVNLNHGCSLLTTHEELVYYMSRYGDIHRKKLLTSFEEIKDKLKNCRNLNIIDYGCGQAMGVINFIDFTKEIFIIDNLLLNINSTIKEIILIEPSVQALQRAILHTECFNNSAKIKPIHKYLNDLDENDLNLTDKNTLTIHIFSNILDIEEISLNEKLYKSIEAGLSKNNIFVCVSPKINASKNLRLDMFYQYFKDKHNATLISNKQFNKIEYGYTKYSILFEVNK